MSIGVSGKHSALGANIGKFGGGGAGGGGGGGPDGSSSGQAAASAQALVNRGISTDGTYWIDVPSVGPRQIYCLLDGSWNGGGWMMVMKATRGGTFQWGSSYWTSNNVLNEGSANTNDGDAKFETFNRYAGTDLLAVWPDLTTNRGCISSSRGTVWLQNNFNSGSATILRSFFAADNEIFMGDASQWCGVAGFSQQRDVRFYGFGYRASGVDTRTRWGFGWNENGGGLWPNANEGSNDVAGGIGMVHRGGARYSAGDYIGCCQNVTGFNRTARVEMYIR